MLDIILVTGNLDKLREVNSILDFKLEHKDLDLDEVQSIDPKVVIEHKLVQAFNLVNKPVVVLDNSLMFGALNGFPGPLIKWFCKTLGNQGIVEMISNYDDKSVIAQVMVGFYDGKSFHYFNGEVEGSVSPDLKGDNGFGWDKLFIPKGSGKTFAQMSLEEKNEYSMRKIALIKFKEFLKK